jgi:hypothetical protein
MIVINSLAPRGERGGLEETALEVQSAGGGKILYYRARGARGRGMNNMTSINKIARLQLQQDCTEPSYTGLKSAINEVGIPIC